MILSTPTQKLKFATVAEIELLQGETVSVPVCAGKDKKEMAYLVLTKTFLQAGATATIVSSPDPTLLRGETAW